METPHRGETTQGPSEILRWVARLAVAASHAINNPLMVIVGNLELLGRTQTLNADGRVHLGAALAAAGQIKEEIRRLGLISRLELAAGGPNLPPMLDLDKSSPEASPTTRDRIEALRNVR